MTTPFGWSDTLYAVTSCFSCRTASSSTDSLNNYAHSSSNLRHPSSSASRSHPQASHLPPSLPEGLRPFLLTDSTDDEYVDTFSLHSNVGGPSGRKKARTSSSGSVTSFETDGDEEPSGSNAAPVLSQSKPQKHKSKNRRKQKQQKIRDRDEGWFTFLGYSLFGKTKPGIQLPLTDDEEEEVADDDDESIRARRGRRNRRGAERIGRSQSGATLDSDAAPLDDAAIARLSQAPPIPTVGVDGATTEQGAELAAVRERVKQAEKEDKRRRRKERKVLERALSVGLSLNDDATGGGSGEFEGFQGSGDGASLVAMKSPPSERLLTDDEDADFDGSIYARPIATIPAGSASEPRTTTSTTTRSSSSTSTSGHRSHPRPPRASRTQSNTSSNANANANDADQFHEDILGLSSQRQFPVDNSLSNRGQQEDRKKKKRSMRKPVPLASSSTATSSQSPSLPSPTGSTSLGSGLSASLSQSRVFRTNVTGTTLPISTDSKQPKSTETPFFSTPSEDKDHLLSGTPTSLGLGLDSYDHGFPSVGFKRTGNGNGREISNGAFLAHRGE